MRPFLTLFFMLPLLNYLSGQEADRATYKSPYSVSFSFDEKELIGDLLKGSKSKREDDATVNEAEWYSAGNHRRWGYWGPAAKHFDPPSGLASKGPEWSRERVIATGLQFAGYSYQHHHIPDWNPPEEWPRDPQQKTPSGKGMDCSNFTAFVYNLALGIKPTGDVQDQAAMTEVAGPGAGRTIPVKRIELPEAYEDYARTLLTGDLLYIKNSSGNLSHVVLWVGKIGKSPDGRALILDSTGTGELDAKGAVIPNGVQLRSFTPKSWYFRQASHALRIIPDGAKTTSR